MHEIKSPQSVAKDFGEDRGFKHPPSLSDPDVEETWTLRYTSFMFRKTNSYVRFQSENLILRDVLAIDRTILANERTLLSFFRTAIMLIASGVTLVKIFPENTTLLFLGCASIIFAVALAVLGFLRYMNVRADMKRILGKP